MAKAEYVYVLRTCNADLTSRCGFQWPEKGAVSCPDWNSTPCCGNGLHGLLWGEGNGGLLDWSEDAKWLVVRVLADEIVKIDDGEKVKFPRGEVVFCGERREATDFLAGKVGAQIRAIVGATATAGYAGTATAGYAGTATAGDEGTATAGYAGTATAGDEGIIIISYWDEDADKMRRVIGHVGDGGLSPGKKYRLDSEHKFVEAD